MARILLTGGSSFSGLWIAEALVRRGHQVTAPLRRAHGDYAGLRAERVERLRQVADVAFGEPFGSQGFIARILDARFDLLAHHAADIPNYRAADYDVGADVSRNLDGARSVFHALVQSGAVGVVTTGTTFEAGEGGGGPGDLALTPYGLSKTLTLQALKHFARWEGLGFGKFVVAAPFGPWEEGRFAWSLFQSWFEGRPGEVRTPRYIRDNIPAPLLGEAYADLVARVIAGPDVAQAARPQGFVGSQEAFARQLAKEMAPRLGLACEVAALPQPHLAEPETRINTDPALPPGWNAEGFWDAYAAYYQRIAAAGLLAAPA